MLKLAGSQRYENLKDAPLWVPVTYTTADGLSSGTSSHTGNTKGQAHIRGLEYREKRNREADGSQLNTPSGILTWQRRLETILRASLRHHSVRS